MQENDEPIQPELVGVMNNIANNLQAILSPNMFVLFVFNIQDNIANYVSNAMPNDVIEAMREFVMRSDIEAKRQQKISEAEFSEIAPAPTDNIN